MTPRRLSDLILGANGGMSTCPVIVLAVAAPPGTRLLLMLLCTASASALAMFGG